MTAKIEDVNREQESISMAQARATAIEIARFIRRSTEEALDYMIRGDWDRACIHMYSVLNCAETSYDLTDAIAYKIGIGPKITKMAEQMGVNDDE